VDDHIERELLIDASPEELWEVITSPGWLADDVDLELVPGGEASFGFDGSSKCGWIEEAVAPEATAAAAGGWFSGGACPENPRAGSS
jgi:uncharacterized protein YndB with AHSA1/START domain